MQTKPNFIFRTVTQGVDSLWSTNLPGNRGGEALFHIARFEGASDVEEEIASHERSIKKDRLFDVEMVPSADVDGLS